MEQHRSEEVGFDMYIATHTHTRGKKKEASFKIAKNALVALR